MKRIICCLALCGAALTANAQAVLTLDSCRALALRNNKQLAVAKLKQVVAENTRKSARTKYLPQIDAMGGYTYMSKSVSLLSDDQQAALASMGTRTGAALGQALAPIASPVNDLMTKMVVNGMLTTDQAQAIKTHLGNMGTGLTQAINAEGKSIADAFDTDTHNLWAGSILLTQPIFMGGRIAAANKMADLGESIAANQSELSIQNTILTTDKAYWLVVSLKHKQALAKSFFSLVSKLNQDVQKMIDEGVATRSDGLSVNVKVNEAEMALTQVEDGLTLSKMALCQLCGLPLETDITLADESLEQTADVVAEPKASEDEAVERRPEIKMLENVAGMAQQGIVMARAEYLPTVALTGGYTLSNPNVYNGFEKKFSGVWNVGVLVRVPVWHWMDGTYKIRSAKAAKNMANLELADAKEKIRLQVSQSEFQMTEACKKLAMANKNIAHAEENLRCANVGFKEGVLSTTNVLEAQTAWLQAQSQKIDAEINVKLTQVNLRKALGQLHP